MAPKYSNHEAGSRNVSFTSHLFASKSRAKEEIDYRFIFVGCRISYQTIHRRKILREHYL